MFDIKAWSKEYRKNHSGHIGRRGIKQPDWYRRRISSWKNVYHIKLLEPYKTYWEMYSVLWIKANKKCQICGRQLNIGINVRNTTDTANLDHNHDTGEPRGVLCKNCNYVVGIVEKRLNGNAKNISDYIKRFNSGLNELQ